MLNVGSDPFFFFFFAQDVDVFNERMRITHQQNNETQMEAVVLKDLTKVCCMRRLYHNHS